MTRINLIRPQALSDKHLGAEYRELPRVFGLVRKAAARGETPDDPRNPTEYTMGKGHVRFFYNKLGFISYRYRQLCLECQNRGRAVNFGNLEDLLQGIPPEWLGQWNPTYDAVQINIQRIQNRGGLRHAINP